MPISKDKKVKALSSLEFRYLAERHRHEAQKMQDKIMGGDDARLFTLSEAENLMGHLSDAEVCLAAAAQIDSRTETDEALAEADAAVANALDR